MGKWTLEHHDEVLRNKIKSMVQGAVKRINVEKEGPSISYEAFVEELDEGDSFTTSLIDVLVKEMAERRTRPNPVDRRLISERTAKVLRMQAAPLHIYRGGQSSLRERASRRSVPILPRHSFSTFHDLLSESDGEDDYGSVMNPSGPLEGARINTDLYDAYFPSTYDLPGSLSRRADPEAGSPPPAPSAGPAESTRSSLIANGPRAQSPPAGRSIWHASVGGSGSSLTRQPSIRRPFRTRTTEFSEFTSRRRSAIRSSTTAEDGPRADSSTDAGSRTSAFGTRGFPESSTADGYAILPWASVRRRSAPSRSGSAGINGGSTSVGVAGPTAVRSTAHSPSSSQLWYSLTSPLARPESRADAVPAFTSSNMESDSEWPQVVAPRLRRGGLRPPESLLPHYYGPAPSEDTASSRPAPEESSALSSSLERAPTDSSSSEHPYTTTLPGDHGHNSESSSVVE
ncbi:hypothetical protein BV20DRAFT_959967 [Pilatotrama ljubarskyi]|nr:hypothetical protein BV20DRAFT_959967 [Pilatotrama ljubarskyi]